MFKVGQKVVCVTSTIYGDESASTCIKGEIYTINWIRSGYLGFEEMPQDDEYIDFCFRPIDYSFGHNLAEEIQEEINQEQLIYEN